MLVVLVVVLLLPGTEFLWLPRHPAGDPHMGDNLIRVSNELYSFFDQKLVVLISFQDVPHNFPAIQSRVGGKGSEGGTRVCLSRCMKHRHPLTGTSRSLWVPWRHW